MRPRIIRLGYKRIGLLKISPSYLSTIKDRTRGYETALRDRGLKCEKSLVKEVAFENMREGVHSAMRELLSPPRSIEALFVLNSNLAAPVFEFIQEAGLRAPQDVAVVSFDDVEYFKFSNPPVTAVTQPLQEIGTKAAELLISRLDESNKNVKARSIALEATLIIRRSCGAFLNTKN